jgi:hypothetical protein
MLKKDYNNEKIFFDADSGHHGHQLYKTAGSGAVR